MGRLLQLFVLVLFISAYPIHAQGYSLKVTINNLADTTIRLGHHFSNLKIPDDTTRLDKNGTGTFKGDKPLPHGMYFILLPNHTYFDILIGDDQEFSISNDTTDFIKHFAVKGSKENELFIAYQRLLNEHNEKAKALSERFKNAKTAKEKDEIRKKLLKLDETIKKTQQSYINENPGTFFRAFIKATMQVDIPETPKGKDEKIFQYTYYRKHYFDHFDIADPRLLRTPFYNDKVIAYLDKVLPQVPDSIIPETDTIIKKSQKTPELFRNMLVSLLNHYAKSEIMGMDAVFVHIAEKYYIPEADWSDSTYIEKLKKAVAKTKHLLLGKKSPNFKMVHVPSAHFKAAAHDLTLAKNPHVGKPITLHQIPGDYTVLIFFEADCGHCKKQIPKLKAAFGSLKDKNIRFVGMHMLGGIEGKEKWIQIVNEYALYDWINTWNPYEFNYRELYDIQSSPLIYVLDKDKNILAKRIDAEQVESIIMHYIQKGK
jgi:hypothetical protein